MCQFSAMEANFSLRQQRNINIDLEIMQLAVKEGHEVLFTSPHYSDLQTIELIWPRVNSSVARQYSKTATLKDVQNRLVAELD